jgi:predicted small lipoprotein YifL
MKTVFASAALLGLLFAAAGCGEPELPNPADF